MFVNKDMMMMMMVTMTEAIIILVIAINKIIPMTLYLERVIT